MQQPLIDVRALFEAAEREGRVGIARKTGDVDARGAVVGEVIVTRIAGEGKETQSPPAAAGDMVVRNRCPVTGDEQYLVAAREFPERYAGPLGRADGEGWKPYRALGPVMRYFLVRPEDGAFRFVAPWGETMGAKPGDAIVREPGDPQDIYRVAAASFACTYDVLEAPRRSF
jgi:hypothetical protein